MNRILLFIGFLIILGCTDKSKDQISKLELEIVRRGHYFIDDKEVYSVNLKIINRDRDICKFWINKCGYLSNVLLKSSDYEILPPVCDNDFPELISLKPNQSINLPLLISKKIADSSRILNDRFGFVFINEFQYALGDKVNLIDLALEFKRNEKQMIWTKNSIFGLPLNNYYIDN
jgi:hypothetical protein